MAAVLRAPFAGKGAGKGLRGLGRTLTQVNNKERSVVDYVKDCHIALSAKGQHRAVDDQQKNQLEQILYGSGKPDAETG